MQLIKYIRTQCIEENGTQHVIVEFINGSLACSCGLARGSTPNLREELVEYTCANCDTVYKLPYQGLNPDKFWCNECLHSPDPEWFIDSTNEDDWPSTYGKPSEYER